MRKKLATLFISAVLAAGMATTAYAGWEQYGTQWKYKNDNGTYSTSVWQWIDGNNDGIAESYCFDGNGYLLTNTTTPDGYTVNADGAWVENGIVQQKTVQASLTGTWQGYEEITGYITTYTFNADGTVHYDIISNYSDYRMFGDTTYTLDGSKILINSDDFYVNFGGNMRLDGNQIIARDAAEEGEFDVFFYRQ